MTMNLRREDKISENIEEKEPSKIGIFNREEIIKKSIGVLPTLSDNLFKLKNIIINSKIGIDEKINILEKISILFQKEFLIKDFKRGQIIKLNNELRLITRTEKDYVYFITPADQSYLTNGNFSINGTEPTTEEIDKFLEHFN